MIVRLFLCSETITTKHPEMFSCPNHPDDVSVFPDQILPSRTLHFQRHWFNKHEWLHYDPLISGVVCYYCSKAERLHLLELARNREEAFISNGFRNWKDALQSFATHARSQSHSFAVERVCHFDKAPPVKCQLSCHIAQEQHLARSALQVIFTTVKFLARQGLAFRGHTDDEGNFMQLLKLRCLDNPQLSHWLERKVDYTSPKAQNDMLTIFSHTIVRSIARDIRSHGPFAVIVDGTQDASRKEQMSVCIRHVDDDFNPYEEFVGMYEPPDTKGNTTAVCVKDVLIRLDLSMTNLRGQTYDGASNMSGEYNGCQAIIAQSQPLALYVHCGAHCVNLVSSAVGELCPTVRDALQVVNELGVLFAQSIITRNKFKDVTTTSEEGAEPGPSTFHQIRPLCPTRWLVRVKAIEAVVLQYSSVLKCLDELAKPGSPLIVRATGLRTQLRDPTTFLLLNMALRVFQPLERLNRSLQSRHETVSGMIKSVSTTVSEIKALRTEEEFDVLLEATVTNQENCNIETFKIPRQRKPPARFTGRAASTVATTITEHYRPIYFSLLDEASTKLEDRFEKSAGVRKYSRLENILITGIIDENDEELLETYPEINISDLKSELWMFRRGRRIEVVGDAVTELRQMLPEVRGLFTTVCILVRLLLVSPASSAEAERSFSALRRLKTWLRTTMTETRLNSVTVCHIHRSRIDTLDIIPLMREFISRSDLSRSTFGQFP